MKFDHIDQQFYGKNHSKYDWTSKNLGKDLILQNRLKIAKRWGLNSRKLSNKLKSYLMEAELGVILI